MRLSGARARCPSASCRGRCRRRRSPRRTGSRAHDSWGNGSGQASRTGLRGPDIGTGRSSVVRGVENVWDYPRPPAVEPCTRRVRVELRGVVLADSEHALRVLETSHPPAIYVPPQHVHGPGARARARSTWCEFKGTARYLDAATGERADGVDVPRSLAGLRGAARLRELLPGPRGHTPGSTTSWSSPRRAASTAAGSRPTSPGRSRGRRARWAGRSPGVLITSEFLTDYEPPDLGADANFFVVARTEGFGEDDEQRRRRRWAWAGSRTARGSPSSPVLAVAWALLLTGVADDGSNPWPLARVRTFTVDPSGPRRGRTSTTSRASGSCSTSSPTARSSRPPTTSSPTTSSARATGARS